MKHLDKVDTMRRKFANLLGAIVVISAAILTGAVDVRADSDGEDNRAAQKLPTPQHAVLTQFAGGWKGKGVLRTSGKTENEVVRCQLKSTLIFDSRFLFQDGKCSAVGRTGSFLVTLAYDKVAEKYTGSWINSINLGIWGMNGDRHDQNLNFKVVHDDPDGARKIESVMTMTWLDKDQYRLVMTSADVETGEEFERSNIVFKRM